MGGFHSHGGTQKWWFLSMTGGTPMLGNLHICVLKVKMGGGFWGVNLTCKATSPATSCPIIRFQDRIFCSLLLLKSQRQWGTCRICTRWCMQLNQSCPSSAQFPVTVWVWLNMISLQQYYGLRNLRIKATIFPVLWNLPFLNHTHIEIKTTKISTRRSYEAASTQERCELASLSYTELGIKSLMMQ